jgi:hypothetical protein
MREFVQGVLLYGLIMFSYVAISTQAVVLTWRVGTGPGLLPVSLSFAVGSTAVLLALVLLCLYLVERYLHRPSKLFLVGLIVISLWGFYAGVFRYIMFVSVYDYNTETTRNPGSSELRFSLIACALLLLTPTYYLWKSYLLKEASSR